MRYVLASILGFLMTAYAVADTIDLKEGQSWSFEDAPHPDTRLVIGKIEPLWDGQETAVSVSVVNLNSERGLLIGGMISHLPFSAQALRAHLLELDETPVAMHEGFDDGYQTWKMAVKQQGAGVFTIAPADAIDFVFDTVWEGQ